MTAGVEKPAGSSGTGTPRSSEMLKVENLMLLYNERLEKLEARA